MENKSILISIQPQWVEKILNGKKTIEIRKTMPKCKLPCKVYIYCTKGQEIWGDGTGETWNGIDENEDMQLVHELNPTLTRLNGKVVAEFTLDKITKFKKNFIDLEDNLCYNFKVCDVKNAGFETDCLSLIDFDNFVEDYGKGKPLFAWHIDNLKIYDRPKELREFSGFIPNNRCEKHENGFACDKCDAYDKEHDTCLALYYCRKPIKRPSQSWCYVEGL